MSENSTPATAGGAAPTAPAPGFTPLLTTYDWNAEWKKLQKARRRVDSAEHWDKRSATFTCHDAPSPYVERFLALAGIRPGETVFDMGCGTGALSVPLGEAGHEVVAADFSQGMLDRMQDRLDARGITTVTPKLMSWEDDWPAHGVRPGTADVALASRSIATADLKDALMRLGEVARRRTCITLTTGSSPRTDERILSAIGLQSALGRDYLYAFNILADAGLKPEVAYIESSRADTFDSPDEAFESLGRMVRDAAGDVASDAERKAALGRLRCWLADNLVENEHAAEGADTDAGTPPAKRLRLRDPRTVTWAFIAWEQ